MSDFGACYAEMESVAGKLDTGGFEAVQSDVSGARIRISA